MSADLLLPLLPDDILGLIFGFIEPPKRVALCLVCQRWRRLLSAPWRWRGISDEMRAELLWKSFACTGRLEGIRWLSAVINLTAADVRSWNNNALNVACQRGHLDVARWLVATFGLTAKDARSGGNSPFYNACFFGHLAVAQWLAATFSLTAADVRILDNQTFRVVCGNGDIEIAIWLTETFNLGVQDAMRSSAVFSAYQGGHLDVLQWLAATFGLTQEYMTSKMNECDASPVRPKDPSMALAIRMWTRTLPKPAGTARGHN